MSTKNILSTFDLTKPINETGFGGGREPRLESVVRSEVDGNESEPDDASRVHREADMLRLVEVLGNLARLDRVHRADDDQKHVVRERQQKPLVFHAAFQHHLDSTANRA